MKKTQNGSDVSGVAFTKWSRSATVGDRLRWLLEARGMTQTDLAATMKRLSQDDRKDIPKQSQAAQGQSAISNLVTDASRKPSAPTLLRMAAALGANPHWIIFGDGQPFEVAAATRKEERDLLSTFRDMDPTAQNALLAAARAMARK